MRFVGLATDYDGTLAEHGFVDQSAVAALERCRASGRKLLLVTGRELPDLLRILPHAGLFDRIVAENGALLCNPATKAETPLAEPPNQRFVSALRSRRVTPLAVGRVIVATWENNRDQVLEAVRELGLELQLIFNKGALMVLPSGVNKATGLAAALADLGLSRHNVVGVGDAENDHAFLEACECAAAVANALPALKERADLVLQGRAGAGVIELIDMLEADDLAAVQPRLESRILLGRDPDGREIGIPAHGQSLMVAGASGGGKSTLTSGVLERLQDAEYQFCAIDPEGDYQSFSGAAILGDNYHPPTVTEVMSVLEKPSQSVIVNLLGIPLEQRPAFFQGLLPRLQEMRSKTGRPHWIVVDEAHHLLPASSDVSGLSIPKQLTGIMLVTLEPDHVAPAMVSSIDTVIAVGEAPQETVAGFCRARQEPDPGLEPLSLKRGDVLMWSSRDGARPVVFTVEPGHTERVRHSRKYAGGDLPPDRSFYFRGPGNRLNLRAQNLMTFLQVMDGVDDETWLHHLRRGDASRWFREAIKSDDLAEAAERVERDRRLPAGESRKRIREEVGKRFTLPA